MVSLNLSPDERTLRQFGFIALVGFGAIGGLILWKGGLFGFDFGRAGAAVSYALFGLGGLSALFSLVAPAANRPVFVGLSVLTFPIGFVVSKLLLLAIFALLITPTALVLRLLGRDPMKRTFDREAESYWEERRQDERLERYLRQF